MSPVTLCVVGAGHRGGDTYGDFCLRHPDRARVVAVAEPDERRRQQFARDHAIAADRQFASWTDLIDAGRLGDGLVVATPDVIRSGPVVAAARLGYGLLVEKPFAPNEDQLDAMITAITETDALVGVAHVLRYTPFFTTLKKLLDDGTIGQLIHLEQTEDVGYWHFAHSYVRGNWRRAAASSPMLLAKACHDLDIITWLVGLGCESVHSVGSLTRFRAEHAPAGAPLRCTDGCPAADGCPFYAPRLYVDRLRDHDAWPATAVTRADGPAARLDGLRHGPYGRCVYHCDNDVVDHQVVTLTFPGGVIASLRVGAFTASNTRTIRLLGSHGEISGRLDTGVIEVRRFLPAPDRSIGTWLPWDRDDLGRSGLPDDETWTITAGPVADPDLTHGHAGGDDGLMLAFVEQLRRRRDGKPGTMPTHVHDTERSHRIAFAAERSRRYGRVEVLAR